MKKFEIVSMGKNYEFHAEMWQRALAKFFKKVIDGEIKHNQVSHQIYVIDEGREQTIYPAPFLCVLGLITEDQCVKSLKVMFDPHSRWSDEEHNKALQPALTRIQWIVREIDNLRATNVNFK